MLFAKRLLALRNDKSLTQDEVGKIIGVGKTAISNYERGYSTPDFEAIITLANYFGVTTDYLLGRDAREVKIDIAPGRTGDISEVQNLAYEVTETLNMALAEGSLSEDQALLGLKLFRQNLEVIKGDKKGRQ